MGLLEKALKYKNEINRNGRETLIDRIQGPAETEMLHSSTEKSENPISGNSSDDNEYVERLNPEDLVPVDEISGNETYISRELEDFISDEENLNFHDSDRGRPSDIISNRLLIDNEEDNPDDSKFIDLPTQDLLAVHELEKELISVDSKEQLFDILSFSLMGHLGLTSSSMIIPDENNATEWKIFDSRGIDIDNRDLSFNRDHGILSLLFKEKKIIDIEDYKNDPDKLDDYYRFISIDTRLVIPMAVDGRISAALTVGNKITSDIFTANDFTLIDSVIDVAARTLLRITEIENNRKEISGLKQLIKSNSELDDFFVRLKSETSLSTVSSIVSEELKNSGVESYSIFKRSLDGGSFNEIFSSAANLLENENLQIKIKITNPLIKEIADNSSFFEIKNFRNKSYFNDIYSIENLKSMTDFFVYPYYAAGSLLGFMTAYKRKDPASVNEYKIFKLISMLIPYYEMLTDSRETEKEYIDTVDVIFKRIEREIERSESLDIPLTITVCSLKNYKRFFAFLGANRTKEFFEKLELLAKKRLSEGEFSARYGRHKLLYILPGKDKKYAASFASSLKNEILADYKNNEIQPLITFISTEYPEDGDNLLNILDILD